MALLDSWSRGSHTAGDVTHPTWRRGSGPGVVLVHEIPGITPKVVAFAEEVVDAGFTVVMPQLFGEAGADITAAALLRTIPRVCVSREFTTMAAGRTSPIATWLRSLARELHDELGGPGVGALGMCFTGGFALAMMVDPSVVAPVVAQPSLPFPIGRTRRADLNLSPGDLATVRQRAADGCAVLGLRYREDAATGTRFDTLSHELGEQFIRVEFPGKGHSTLTEHRQQEGVDRVLAFFSERLRGDV